MKPQDVFAEMYDKLGNFQNNGGKELLNELTKGKKPKESATLIAELFMQRFDNGKPDDLEWLIKEILVAKPELAKVDLPYNPIFAAAVINGVFDVYRGYVDSGIEIVFKDKTMEEKAECYFDLSLAAQEISDDLSPKYQQCFKGMHYNTAFSRDEEKPHILKIHQEDIDFYESIVKSYNSIIGRRNIIDDLEKRSNSEE